VLQRKYLPVPCEKLNVVLMCVVPPVVPVLSSVEHISSEVQCVKMY
jgi:hypothetical protein